MKKIYYILISLIFLTNISACTGYKPIFGSTNLEFKITDYAITGDKKIGNQIYSRLYNLCSGTKTSVIRTKRSCKLITTEVLTGGIV